MSTSKAFRAGAERIDATHIKGDEYAYYADETSCYYRVTRQDIIDLGEMILNGERDAYGLWCPGRGREMTAEEALEELGVEYSS